MEQRRQERAREVINRVLADGQAAGGLAVPPGERNLIVLGVLLIRINPWIRAALPAMSHALHGRCMARFNNPLDAGHHCPTKIWDDEAGKRCLWQNINGRIPDEVKKVAKGTEIVEQKTKRLTDPAIPESRKDGIRTQLAKTQVQLNAATAELRGLMPATMWRTLRLFARP